MRKAELSVFTYDNVRVDVHKRTRYRHVIIYYYPAIPEHLHAGNSAKRFMNKIIMLDAQ